MGRCHIAWVAAALSLTVGAAQAHHSFAAEFDSNRDVTFSDGRKLFLGSSGTGAPADGRDASEK
jgi:hypothetical protein